MPRSRDFGENIAILDISNITTQKKKYRSKKRKMFVEIVHNALNSRDEFGNMLFYKMIESVK